MNLIFPTDLEKVKMDESLLSMENLMGNELYWKNVSEEKQRKIDETKHMENCNYATYKWLENEIQLNESMLEHARKRNNRKYKNNTKFTNKIKDKKNLFFVGTKSVQKEKKNILPQSVFNYASLMDDTKIIFYGKKIQCSVKVFCENVCLTQKFSRNKKIFKRNSSKIEVFQTIENGIEAYKEEIRDAMSDFYFEDDFENDSYFNCYDEYYFGSVEQYKEPKFYWEEEHQDLSKDFFSKKEREEYQGIDDFYFCDEYYDY